MPQDRPSREGPPTSGPPSAESLREAFRFALGGRQPADFERLRLAACDFVRELRVRGLSPEATVVAVKDVLRRDISGQTPTHDSRREADALVERVVTWCIEEYYRSERGEEM